MRFEVPRPPLVISNDAWHRIPPFLAGIFIFLVYLRTMAPSVFTLDSAELTTAAYSLGLVHSPGYPIYLLLTHIFIKLPIADVGYRVNLFSGLASAVNVGVLIAIIKLMTGRHLPAIAAGLSFGLSYYVWSASVVAEVYALQGLMLTTIMFAIFQWRRLGKVVYLRFLAVIAGLAVANNPGTLLWFPGLIGLIGFTPGRERIDRRAAAEMAVLFISTLSLILYLPLRSAHNPSFINVGHFDVQGVFHPMDLTRPANLFWYLAGRQFEPLFFAYSPAEYLRESVQFFHWLWAAFIGIGLPLGFWGLIKVWRTHLRTAQALVLTVLPHMLFFIGYGAPDKDTMFLPVFVVWTLFLGVGLAELLEIIPERLKLTVFALPLALLVINSSYADVSNFYVPGELARARLRSVEQDAIYLARWGAAEAMQYQQVVNRYRTDVDVINLFFMHPGNLEEFIEYAIGNNRPVYAAFEIPGLEDRFEISKVDHGYQMELKGKKP